jgi:hypothetical protein
MLLLVATSRRSARSTAKWLFDDTVRLDHAVLTESDAEWLGAVRHLTVWAVKVPSGFFRTLPSLEWLDVRGGSGESAEFVEGCVRLRYLAINQVRGLRDLTSVGDLANLELLSLYGLPQVRSFPSLGRLERLRRIEAGSLKGIEELGPLLDAPGLEELILIRAVSLSPSDPTRIAEHPTLSGFDWFAEDVPDKTWMPVVERVGRPKARATHPEEWFDTRK